MKTYLLRHLQVILSSLGHLWRQPLASIMTILVIAIALVLPAILFVLSQNMSGLGNRWDNDASQISVFLSKKVSSMEAKNLSKKITSWPEINQIHYQSAQQSLDEFKSLYGLSDVIDSLPENPLPALLIIEPKVKSTDEINALLARLQAMPQIDQAQLDMAWLQRFRSIQSVFERGISVLAILLSLSVILAIGNTIRLSILSRESEIRVMKLVGATDSFIRRPFLYTGFWYGALGGLIAWLTLIIMLSLLSGPVHQLAAQYGSDFSLQWFALLLMLLLPLIGVVLGITGAWLAVSRHLHLIEPS